MGQFWRPVARALGWIDLALQCTILLVVSLVLLYRYEFHDTVLFFGHPVAMWTELTVVAVVETVQILAATQLIFATEKGRQADDARGKAFAWAFVRFIVFLASVIYECFSQQDILWLLVAIWHGGSLLIACFFMFTI